MQGTEDGIATLRQCQGVFHPDCWVCAGRNGDALALSFRLLAGQAVEASFRCDERLQGYSGWLHGGTIAAILDGAMTNCLFAAGHAAVTAELKVRFRHPVPVGADATVRAQCTRRLGPLFIVRAEIRHQGRIMATGEGKFIERQRSAMAQEQKTVETPGTARPEPAASEPFFGRMNDPVAAASLKGPCGDEMELYLDIRDGVIREVRYYTEGCGHTRSCGAAVAARAQGRTPFDALAINPREIIDAQECLPDEGRHCAILAVSTLYRAIAAYLLAP